MRTVRFSLVERLIHAVGKRILSIAVGGGSTDCTVAMTLLKDAAPGASYSDNGPLAGAASLVVFVSRDATPSGEIAGPDSKNDWGISPCDDLGVNSCDIVCVALQYYNVD